jgi:hypothetical protein
VNLEGLARLGWPPLAIDIADVLLEQRRVFELEHRDDQGQPGTFNACWRVAC